MSKALPFKISSNLKNIIGKDLINDRYIAVFELVKNSYDAGANNVSIEFIDGDNPQIIIKDDGCGMSYDDIVNKWLFVAYSEKKEKNLLKKSKDYRSKLKRQFAGAKGVGRFSCDRLGAKLHMLTSTGKGDVQHSLFIDWAKFEEDDEREFINIKVEYEERKKIGINKGTTLIISELREVWDRDSILTLKKSLMKLINPQEEIETEDSFSVELISNREKETDAKVEEENRIKGINDFSYSIVNGKIINDIFDKLNIKTTRINVNVLEDGKTIETSLHDRGVFVFKFKEKNIKYTNLRNLQCKIYYMNRAAKLNFTRQMGTEPINYGSIFVYKNSFRVYPYGEPGRDFFDIDRRKTQGYNRYFGTREIMGQIKIIGDNEYFYETTSRDGGFVRNDAVEELELFFKEKVLRVLEKYVVDGIDWGDPTREEFIPGVKEQGVMPYDVKDFILSQFNNISNRPNVVDAEINPEFLESSNVVEKTDVEKALDKIKGIGGAQTAVETLAKALKKARYKQYEAENEQQKTQEELVKAEREIETRKRQNDANIRKIDKNVTYLEDGHHLVNKFATEIAVNLKTIARKCRNNREILQLIDEIYVWNNRVRQLSNLATKGNYDFKGRKPADIVEFINELKKNHPMSKRLNITVECRLYKIVMNFIPSDIAVIFDNVVDNSYKAKAKNLKIILEKEKDYLRMSFIDDGCGLSSDIKDVNAIFEVSYSKTGGTGLGLSHVKRIAKENDGDVKYVQTEKGFYLQVRIKYESRFQNTVV